MNSDIRNKIKQQLNSRSGRNTLTFLVFLAISTLFWFLMSLNDDIQHDYELPVTIENLPEDMTLLSPHGETPMVTVTVRDKGVNHLSKQFIKSGALKVNYRDFTDVDNNRLLLSETQLGAALRQYFGSSATITQSTDSLSIPYTTLPPIKVPVVFKSQIKPKPQYTVCGPLKSSADSVLIYSAQPLENVQAVFTDIIRADGISDTTAVKVTLLVPARCRAVPSEITVTIPVEPLVSKTFSIPVEPINAPAGSSIVTFPSTVNFTCLLPMSLYNTAGYPLKAYADYNKRTDNTITLEMSLLPDSYINGSLSPSSVEYIIENK